MSDEPRVAPAPRRDGAAAPPLLIGVALLNVVTLVLLGMLLGRITGVEERLAETGAALAEQQADAAQATEAVEQLEASVAAEIEVLRTAILDELDTIRFRGVVPTDSSGVILERLEALEGSLGRIDEIADTLERLEERLDQICEGVPVC